MVLSFWFIYVVYIYTVHVKSDMQFSIIKIQTVFQWQVSRKSNELSTVNVQINNKQILQNAIHVHIMCIKYYHFDKVGKPSY